MLRRPGSDAGSTSGARTKLRFSASPQPSGDHRAIRAASALRSRSIVPPRFISLGTRVPISCNAHASAARSRRFTLRRQCSSTIARRPTAHRPPAPSRIWPREKRFPPAADVGRMRLHAPGLRTRRATRDRRRYRSAGGVVNDRQLTHGFRLQSGEADRRHHRPYDDPIECRSPVLDG